MLLSASWLCFLLFQAAKIIYTSSIWTEMRALRGNPPAPFESNSTKKRVREHGVVQSSSSRSRAPVTGGLAAEKFHVVATRIYGSYCLWESNGCGLFYVCAKEALRCESSRRSFSRPHSAPDDLIGRYTEYCRGYIASCYDFFELSDG